LLKTDFFLMPQFDIFSFNTQLFWVFFLFIALYSCICFIILPALSSILKARKIKLTQTKMHSNVLTSKSLLIKNVDIETNNLFNNNISLEITNASIEKKCFFSCLFLTLSFENLQKCLVLTKNSVNFCVACN